MSSGPRRRETRTTARLVLFDPRGRILLFLHADGMGRRFWATPGGGVEEGESLEQAARREASEELGAHDVDLTYLWTGLTEFEFADKDVSQTEAFFQVTGNPGVLGPEVEATHRRERILESRWWAADEIEASRDRILPLDLAKRVREFGRKPA
ncbi:MAG TPA: NUDIX domain-containing protein [Candidatus Eisenbacteria bacterium]|nr:NUDIX domain-containing protein [Candidatus Eisenbacteria bacterium]